MTPERREKLALWLGRLAEAETFTASVLARIEHGNPEPCLTKARLFREIAGELSGKPVEAPPLPAPPPTPPTPPAASPEAPRGRQRAPL